MAEPLRGNRLLTGCIVEFHEHDFEDGGSQLAQLVSCDGPNGTWTVATLSGCTEGSTLRRVPPSSVRLAFSDRLSVPSPISPTGFDAVFGPLSRSEVLGEVLATAVAEKGFCVVRFAEGADMRPTLRQLKERAQMGSLSRLAEECEEAHLGTLCRGLVAPLDHWEVNTEGLRHFDRLLTTVQESLAKPIEDVLGHAIVERTHSLACLTFRDGEEHRRPQPSASMRELTQTLETWRKTLLHGVLFLGPGDAEASLESRGTEEADWLPLLELQTSILAKPGTLLLFRPDLLEYTCRCREPTLLLVTSFLRHVPALDLSSVLLPPLKDLVQASTLVPSAVDGPLPPPPGPSGGVVNIRNTATRLPGNWDSPEMYKNALCAGADVVVQVPIERWDVGVWCSDDVDNLPAHCSYQRHQSLCEGVELFDARMFEISPLEATGMDPVQRLVLECTAQSLHQIGLTKTEANKKAIHAGASVGNDKLDWMSLPKDESIPQPGTSVVLAIIANRLSFVFNLKGPCFVCDTACSASLVSTHLAKLAVMERKYDPLEWHISLGAHLCLSPGPFIGCSHGRMASVAGRCFTFNATADGYLRGEGISSILMQYGNVAEQDRECILRATMVGQDGRSASLTAPNGPAQEEIVRKAIREGQMTPSDSTTWECHGTGTTLGDPIEVGAVRRVQVTVERSEPLMMAANKSNLGHLEGGAAMAAIVKCVLQAKNGHCYPTLHLGTLNPHLEHAVFDALFMTEGMAFRHNAGNCQVSSFGFGGTNAHGIFWGHKQTAGAVAPEAAFLRRLQCAPPPEVRAIGRDPMFWETDAPDMRDFRQGDQIQVQVDMRAPLGSCPLLFKKVARNERPDEDASYALTGNFNGWSPEPMQGQAPGLWAATLRVPVSGPLEFQVLRNNDVEQVVCPIRTTSAKSGRAVGPGRGLQNVWQITEPAGSRIAVEFFVAMGEMALAWKRL